MASCSTAVPLIDRQGFLFLTQCRWSQPGSETQQIMAFTLPEKYKTVAVAGGETAILMTPRVHPY